MENQKRTALITGATRGIGAAIAQDLGKLSFTVAATATTEAGAKTITQRLTEAGIDGTGMVLDVTNSASIADVISRIENDFGPVDVLVNNAGITKDNIIMRMKEDEWLDVGAWVYNNFDMMSGVSFLPFSEHTYKQAPYQDVAKEEFEVLLNKMPKEIDWSKLGDYEKTDMTIGAQELACVAGGCEI